MPLTAAPFKSMRNHQDHSIARRLAVSLIITVCIVSGGAMSLIYYQETRRARLDLEQKADDIVAYQIDALGKPLWDLDHNAIRMIGKSIARNEIVAELIIRDYFGREAYIHKKAALQGLISRSARVLYDDVDVGGVFISLSTHLYRQGNRNVLSWFALIILLILISLIFVAGFLVRTFLNKPLSLLNDIVESYASGEYHAIDPHQPYIEFKPFTDILRQMGDKIAQQLTELSAAEEKYRSIFENAIEGMFQSTPDGKFLNVNPAMADILGYDSPQALLQNVNDIAGQFYVEPDDRIRLKRMMELQERVLEFESRFYRRDGRIIDVSISARTVRDAHGRLQHYEGFLVDVTRRKRAAESLRQVKEQLALLLESLPIVPFTCRADGNFGITYVSKTIQEVTGYRPEQFTGNSSFWADHVLAKDRNRIFRRLPDVIQEEKCRAEYRFRAADGSYRWFDDTRRVVKTAAGAVSYIAGAWRDITEDKRIRKEAEYRLQQVIQADKMASLGQVVSGVAHEINNPNSFIATNAPQLAEIWRLLAPILERYAQTHPNWHHRGIRMLELCDDMVEIIQAIKIGSDRINRIVSDLKEFVRQDDRLCLTPVNLNQVVDKAYTIFGAQVRKSIAGFKTMLAPDLPLVQGHFQKLEQIVTNLVVNALSAVSDKHTGKLSISTRHLPAHAAVALAVEDNGLGMTPDIVDRIFEPFFTLRRDSGGTGLGLSVSYGLVKEHSGILGVLSRPGKGSRFTIFLPDDSGIALQLKPAVLGIGDDPALARFLTSFFDEDQDWVLIEAPEQALPYLEQNLLVDIIIMQLDPSDGAGWSRLSAIKARFPLITVISYADDPAGIDLPSEPTGIPDHLLIKPYDAAELKRIITSIGRQRL